MKIHLQYTRMMIEDEMLWHNSSNLLEQAINGMRASLRLFMIMLS